MNLKQQIIKGAAWTLIGQFGYMFVSLFTNIILARILSPYEFGQMGILMFFVVVANIFIEGGFGGALIRKTDIKPEDYSTIFIFNLFISTVLYLLIGLFSGIISDYYHDHALQNLLLVICTILFFNALSITTNAKLIREMEFKKKAIVQLVAVCFSAVVSICLANFGWGVWALIIFQLLSSALNSLFLLIYGGLKFSFTFNKDSFKDLYAFGINTTAASVIASAFDNIYSLILGRYFSISQVGFYYQANRLQVVPYNASNAVVQSVIYSSLSKIRNERKKLISAYNKIMLLLTVLIGIITTLIYLYSESIVLLLYGAKWKGSIFFMQLLCIASFFFFQEQFNYIVFKIFNKTRRLLYLEIIKKMIQMISIVYGVLKMDIDILLYGFILSSIISFGLNYYFSAKLIGDNFWFPITTLVKILSILLFNFLIFDFLIKKLDLNFKNSLFLLPGFLLLVYLFLKIFKICDLLTEFKEIKNLAKS